MDTILPLDSVGRLQVFDTKMRKEKMGNLRKKYATLFALFLI